MKFIKTTTNADGSLPKSLPLNLDEARKLWAYTTDARATTQIGIIDQIANMWSDRIKNNGNIVVEDIFIEKQRMMVVDSKNKIISTASDSDIEEMSAENLAVARMIAKVSVKGLSNEISPSIGILITEKDEQYGIGQNTHICSNFSILGTDKLYNSKESPKNAPKDWLIKSLKNYMKETLPVFENDYKTIESLHKTEVSEGQFHEFVGCLYQQIEYANYARLEKKIKELSSEEKMLPLTGRQLSHIVIESKKPKYAVYNWSNKTTSLWSLINHGTEVLKFEKNLADSLNILRANKNWNELVQKRFLATEISL